MHGLYFSGCNDNYFIFIYKYYIVIGGVPDDVNELTGGRYSSGWSGCIADVVLSDTASIIDFSSTVKARGSGIKQCNS